MAAFSDLLAQVKPECPTCPDNVLINEVRKAVRDFCERSTYWRDSEEFSLWGDQDDGEYTYTPPAGAQIVSFINPFIWGSTRIDRVSTDWLDSEYHRDWRNMIANRAEYYRITAQNKFRLIPRLEDLGDEIVPAAEGGDGVMMRDVEYEGKLVVGAALKPTATATEIPDYVYDEWYEALADGALGALLSMDGQDWFKPERSLFKMAKFEDGVMKARQKAINEFASDTVDRRKTVRGHYF